MTSTSNHHESLRQIAHRAMLERGLEPDFSASALKQLDSITAAAPASKDLKDLRSLLWCSIDNDDSRDLDQLTVAEPSAGGNTKILVAVADVDALVKADTPIDRHAGHNTTSVYTAAEIFPMLPERLSTDLTSLADGQDRAAVITEMTIAADGTLVDGQIYRALVHNWAKLAYNSTAAWLDGKGPMPEKAAAVAGMDRQLQLQRDVALAMKQLRFQHGALDFDTIEPRAVMKDGKIVDLRHEPRNVAMDLIADFMIGANGVSARYLDQRGSPSLRRVVRRPKRWDRIVAVAAKFGEKLPVEPDSGALSQFLTKRRAADPLRFPDLSLTIVKLLGRGEYVLEMPGQRSAGHFGLAVQDYSHSTAPNRRYPDLITQRLLKAAIAGARPAYDSSELAQLAQHCTEQEDAATKVERRVRKSAAALLLAHRIGEVFDALVTGASEQGTWVRLISPPVEGKLIAGTEGLDVGDRLKVALKDVNIEQGFIDFVRAS